MSIDSVGIIALILTIGLQLPTVYTSLRNRCVENQDWRYLSTYLVTCLLWTIYGFDTKVVPLGLAATLSLVFCILMMVLKYKYGDERETATV
jgi:uncharacterized protein with PQ loop repeat